MDKTYRTEITRRFLIEQLPEPLTRASAHIQFFDNYLTETRLRLRTIRDPLTKEWTWILQQRSPAAEGRLAALKIGEIYLNEAEHARFELFEGTEIRKNRYFHEFDGQLCSFDVYLGPLWGLNMMIAEFGSLEEAANYQPPAWVFKEVTDDRFFYGDVLVEKTFADIQRHLAAGA